MDECYLSSDSSDEEIIKSKNTCKSNDNDFMNLEQEFEQLIEQKIINDHKIELNKASTSNKSDEVEFYDPNQDDEDEEYIQSLIISNQFDKKSNGEKSDDTFKDSTRLNCPCCTTLLCLDCQRHVNYKNQYRAMFTLNCSVDKNRPIEQPTQNKITKKRKKNKQNESLNLESNDKNEILYPVMCAICSEEVGVYDSEEIYHFYNILASY